MTQAGQNRARGQIGWRRALARTIPAPQKCTCHRTIRDSLSQLNNKSFPLRLAYAH